MTEGKQASSPTQDSTSQKETREEESEVNAEVGALHPQEGILGPGVRPCSGQALRQASMISTTWYSCPCINASLPLSVGRTCDLLPTNRIWQRQQGVHDYVYVITLHVILVISLQGDTCPCWLCKASCHAMSFLVERTTWQGTKGTIQPTANKKLRPSVWQPTRNWMLLTTMWAWEQSFSQFNSDENSALTALWLQPCKRPSKPWPESWPTKTMR